MSSCSPPGPHPDTDNIMDPKPAEGEEQKKRRGRKKSKLEDMFPAYLQVRSLPLCLCVLRTTQWHNPAHPHIFAITGGVLWQDTH